MSIFAGVSAGMGGAGSLGTLFIRLTANASDLIKGMDQAETKIDRSTAVMGKRFVQFGLVAAGALAGIGVAAAREFAAFESSFAGIKKTVSGTPEEFERLSASLRKMSREMPVNINELNKITEMGGQLGISGVENLTNFTNTISKFTTATGIAGEEAATSFARIANVMQEPIENIDRMGSVVAQLGDAGAATEREILEMATRIAGAGKIAGLTSAEIFGIASAFSSAGIEAEAGGTAIQEVLLDLTKQGKQGIGEFTKFVDDLAASGDGASQVLTDLGFESSRLQRAFLSVAGAGGMLNQQLKIGTKEWSDNNRLTEEAEKRYETLESQLVVTQNLLRDIAIDIGSGLAPAIKDLNKDLQENINAGNGMNETWKQLGGTIGSTMNVVVKGAVMIGTGLMNAFKLVSIAILDGAATIIEFFDKASDALAKMIRQPGVAFEKTVNVILDGVNYLISKIPDAFWKLIGADPGIGKNFIPTFEAKFDDLPGGSPLAGWAEGLREQANVLGAELERQFLPTAELKRTMEEVTAEMEKQATYSEKEMKMLAGAGVEAEKLVAAKERENQLAREREETKMLMSRFDAMGSPEQVAGPQTFGFGFGNPELGGAIGLQQEIAESKEALETLDELWKSKAELTAAHQVEIEELWAAHSEKIAKLRQAEYELAIVSSEQMFGDLSSIAEAFAGRQSGIYKAMFAASKAFAIAESIIKIQQGVAAAAAMPWPVNLAAIASVVAATSNIVSSIQSVKLEFGGARAEGGPVNPSQSFLVGERGPEMFVPNSRGTIIPNDEVFGGGGGNVRVIVNNFTDAEASVTERMEGNEKVIEIAVKRAKDELTSEVREDRGNFNRAVKDSFGLGRKGR